MIILKTVLFSLILIFNIKNSPADTYYLSNSGNDFNDGLSRETSWKTIAKLNFEMEKFIPGDLILFERGNVFTGQINIQTSGSENSPVIFGAYGVGKNPVITGSVPVSEWSVHHGKIFKTSVDAIVNNFFIGEKQMVLARYPNSGFLTIKEPFSNPREGFTDHDLLHPPGYWNGANVRVRTTNWSYEHSTVKNFDNGKITFSYETYYPTVQGWGYYLDNIFNELDTISEWYFEKNKNSNGILYHYFAEDINPGEISAEGSVLSYGFYSKSDLTDIIIRSLEIRNQNVSGIYLSGNNLRIKVEDCSFMNQVQSAVSFLGKSRDCIIDYCRFNNINGEGLYLLNCKKTIISNCIFRNIGLVPGYGQAADAFTMSSIVILSSDSSHIFRNYLDSVGHDGINCIGNGNVIERNLISNVMLLLNDGAAIKSYGQDSKYSLWKNNFIFNVPGSLEGASKADNPIGAIGIYLDAYCNNIIVSDNTISNCGYAGIFLYEGCEKNFIGGNICYNNPVGIEFYQNQRAMTGNIVLNNIFLGLNSQQIAVKLRARTWDFFPGFFDSNYYFNPFNENLFHQQAGKSIRSNNFTNWKLLTGNTLDINSMTINISQTPYTRLFLNMSDDNRSITLDENYLYKDLNLNNISGSITIPPWYSKVVLMNSDVSNSPEINIAGGPLYFENISGKDYSLAKWYNLIGNNLKDPVTVTASANFRISTKDDTGFTNTLTINHENGKINKIIFVKFIPDGERIIDENIKNTSGELTSLIKVTGNP